MQRRTENLRILPLEREASVLAVDPALRHAVRAWREARAHLALAGLLSNIRLSGPRSLRAPQPEAQAVSSPARGSDLLR